MAYKSNWDAAPWAIDGVLNGVDAARLAVWATSSGAEGVIGVNDLRVRQLNVPGAGVQVAPGGALVLNRSVGGDQQTYTPRLAIPDYPEIASTGSSGGRTDLIYVAIEDPYESGTGFQPPADPEAAQFVHTRVVSGVSDSVTELQQVPGYSRTTGYAIARVKIPANTATITDAMITNLRRVALPRKDPQMFAKAQTGVGEPITATSTAGEVWPNSGVFTADVPKWATRVQVLATWSQVQCPADADGSAYGRLWIRLGAAGDASTITTQENSWDTPDVPKGFSRVTYTVADDIYVPAALRGRSIPVAMMARRANVGAAKDAVKTDAVSGVALQLNFLESAE